MAERWRFDLEARVPSAWPEAGPETETVKAFLVRYSDDQPNKPLHVFLYPSPRLFEINVPAFNALLNYATARLEIRRAERALEAAKEMIVEFVRQAGSASAEKVVRIRADDQEDAPHVTLFHWKRQTAARVVQPETRLSIQTLPDDEEDEEPPITPPPSDWTAVLTKTKKEKKKKGEEVEKEEWEVLSKNLYEFLVSNHRVRLDAEERAKEAYMALAGRIEEFKQEIQALREWAKTTQFIVQKGGRKETDWRDALAWAVGIQEPDKELLVISGLAVPLSPWGTKRWALIAVYEMPGGLFSTSESEGWSFRFPREG